MFVVVLVLVAVGVGVYFLSKSPVPQVMAPSTEQPLATNSPVGTGQTVPHVPGTVAPVIAITSPKASDIWAVGTLHTISWANYAGVTGGIYLVDMKTGTTFGWITSNLDAQQVYFDWDTSSVFTTRGGGLKKNLTVGTYEVRIKFDTANRPESVSPVFSIVYPEQIKPASYTVTVKNYAFSPKSLTVNKGDNVTFVNNDSVLHHVDIANLSPLVLQPGASVTLETSVLAPSTYNYYCDIHPSMTGTLVVK